MQHKLTYQLDCGEVFLPPQVFLVAGAKSSQAIVSVHEDMYNTVQQSMERSLTTWKMRVSHMQINLQMSWEILPVHFVFKKNFTCSKPDSKPPGEGHDGVVIDMKKCHLAVLLPQDKEDLKRDQ